MLKQKRICQEVIKVELRKAVTAAWEAGYAAGERGERKDCEPDVVENIISDAWDKIKKTVGDLLDAITDAVNDTWDDIKKKIDEMWGDLIPWN